MVKNNNLKRKKKRVRNEFSQKIFVDNINLRSRGFAKTRVKKHNSIIQKMRNRFGKKK